MLGMKGTVQTIMQSLGDVAYSIGRCFQGMQLLSYCFVVRFLLKVNLFIHALRFLKTVSSKNDVQTAHYETWLCHVHCVCCIC